MCKYETWEEVSRTQNKLRPLFSPPKEKKQRQGWWAALKKDGVGETTLVKYLDDICSKAEVRYAIATLRDEKTGSIDRERVKPQYPLLEK